MRPKTLLMAGVLAAGLMSPAWASPVAAQVDPPAYCSDLTDPMTFSMPVLGQVADVPVEGLAAATALPDAPVPQPIDLPPGPSALLLGLVGCALVGLAHGRRLWAALLVSLVSVCVAGLSALPKKMAAFHARRVAHAPIQRPVEPEVHRLHLAASDVDRDFIGLLHRLGTEGGAESGQARISSPAFTPAVGSLVAAPLTAGSLVRISSWDTAPAAFPTGAAFEPALRSALPPRPDVSRPPSPSIPHSLFARPPPCTSSHSFFRVTGAT